MKEQDAATSRSVGRTLFTFSCWAWSGKAEYAARLAEVIEKFEAEDQEMRSVTEAEWAMFVLSGLISYHERMTMFKHPELDAWKEGLKFALACVEEKVAREDMVRGR